MTWNVASIGDSGSPGSGGNSGNFGTADGGGVYLSGSGSTSTGSTIANNDPDDVYGTFDGDA